MRYIADLINGIGPDANAQRGRGPRRSRRMSTQVRDNAQVNADLGSRNNRGSSNHHFNAPSPSSRAKDAEEGKYNHPSENSTNTVYHCATCDVWVPSRPGDWEVHIAGIRHRRHVLSLREYGERGRLVLSAFEGDPKPGYFLHIITGKASAAEFGLVQGASSSGHSRKQRQEGEKKGTQQQDDPRYASLVAMRTEAMTRILGIYGHGRMYTAGIDNFFNIPALAYAKERSDGRLTIPSRLEQIEAVRNLLHSPSDLMYIAHKLKVGPRKQEGNAQGGGPALDAGAVNRDHDQHAALEDFLLPPVIVLEMEYGQESSDFIAAWLCSLQSFVHALAENPDQVVRLIIIIRRDFPVHLRETVKKSWDRILSDIENVLLAKNAKLEEIRFYLFAGAFRDPMYTPPEPDLEAEDESMIDTMNEAYPKFEKKAKETAANKRSAILMSQHPRLGRCSVLQLLPEPAVRHIVEEAVTKRGCVIFVKRVDAIPRFKYKPGEWTVSERERAIYNFQRPSDTEDEDPRSEEEEEEEAEDQYTSHDEESLDGRYSDYIS